MKQLSTTILFLLISLQITAQISLSGKLIDATTKETLPFATIMVLQAKAGSDSVKTGVSSDIEGKFLIQNLIQGNTQLSISFVGYQKTERFVMLKENKDLGTILILPETSLLKEVTVVAQKNTAELSLDKRVFNVSDGITAIGGTAENLLRNIPTLAIDSDGSALLRNSTATIYINGKPTQLSLAQIPADQIESVEVISNPSAKYEAAAKGGIVNLVLKKNRKSGYNGTVSAGLGNAGRFNGMLNLELNKGKWNTSAIYNVNASQNPLDSYAYRTNFKADGSVLGYFNQNTDTKRDNVFQNIRLATDYNLNKNNTITLAATHVNGKFNSITNQSYVNLDANSIRTAFGERKTTPQNSYINNGIELDWKHLFAQKRTLSFTSAYNRNNSSNAADWLTTSLNSNGSNLEGSPEKDKIEGNTIGNQIVAQLDYTHPINDSTKWEFGLRSLTNVRDQQYFFNQFQESTNSFNLLLDYSQNARITETVNAAYALYTTTLRNKISLQAGLRIEQSSLRGVSRFEPFMNFGYDYPSTSGKNFFKALFPSFAMSKKLSEESEIGINLSRKIGRPGWRQIFIGIQSADKQNVTIGNPALQPEFVNTAELNYNKSFGKTNWLSSLYYIYEDNTIKPFVQPSETDPSILITTFTNVKVDIQGGFENTLSFYVVKNLSVLASLNVFNFTLQTTNSSKNIWTGRSKLNFTYKFGGNISAQLNGEYSAKSLALQGSRGAIAAADFALRKSFWNNKGNIAFTINDIFNSRKQISIYDQPLAYQESMNRRDVRYYKLTLQLPLNRNVTSKKKPQNNGNHAEEDFGN